MDKYQIIKQWRVVLDRQVVDFNNAILKRLNPNVYQCKTEPRLLIESVVVENNPTIFQKLPEPGGEIFQVRIRDGKGRSWYTNFEGYVYNVQKINLDYTCIDFAGVITANVILKADAEIIFV